MISKINLLCIILIILVVNGWAQEITGSLEGRVLDSEGEPLAEVNIIIEGPNLQSQRSAITDNRGYFRVLALPVGSYNVKILHDVYQDVNFQDVSIRLGKTRWLGEIRLQLRVVERHEIVVSAEKPLIDFSSTEIGKNLGFREYEMLPVERDYRSMATLLPHVNVSYLGDEVSFAGTTGLENRCFIDGVDVTDPFRGSSGTNLPHNFIKEIEIRAGGYQAEYRSSLGGIVNVITYSGGNSFQGKVFGFFVDDRFTAEPRRGALEPNTGDFSLFDFGFGFDGPIIRDKLWFFAAYDPTVVREDVEIPGVGFFKDRSTTHSFAGKLTWQINERNNLVFKIFGDPSKRHGVGETFGSIGLTPVALANPDPYLMDIERWGINLSLNGWHAIGDKFLIHSSLSRISRKEKYMPSTERGRSEPLFIDAESGIWSGGALEFIDNFSIQTTFGIKGTFLFGRHIVKTGFEFRENKLDYDNSSEDLERYSANDFAHWILSKEATLRNRIPSFFIQDSWQVTDRLRVNAGLRWDGQFLVGSEGKVAQRILNQYQPRIGFIFQLGKVGSQKIIGSFGRYYQELATFLSTTIHIEGGIFRFTFFDHDPRIDPSGGIVIEIPSTIHPEVEGLEGQHYDEFTLGYERLMFQNYKLGLRGIYRTLRHGIENGFDPITGELGFGNPGKDPLHAFPRMKREYVALEFTLEKYGGERFNFFTSYVLSRSYGNYPGLYNTDFGWPIPNANGSFDLLENLTDGTGLLPNDRTHVFKFAGSYRFGLGLSVGTLILWQSGTPLSEFGGSSFAGFYNFIRQRGTAGRTPSIFDLNFRFVYDFSQVLKTKWKQKLILDIFHVGSQRTVVNYEQVHYFNIDEGGNQINPNPIYGHATRYSPPMSVRLGIEFNF